ncbi:hypothetical protein K435DRAFT_962149 [Dendrothele bispora CBS 962.96]|uniref:Uncharacterized protein n=1 Tax=Dendrothele bispora (strain CBS 962.96) TaxID=1314807 RepID=A0A4S8MM93_DENBC|nr:hypothetical protein K435DRAFT_962149 [Dendrothele bispora CBS 962.96]
MPSPTLERVLGVPTALVPTPGEPEIGAPTALRRAWNWNAYQNVDESPAVTLSAGQATPSTLEESEESGFGFTGFDSSGFGFDSSGFGFTGFDSSGFGFTGFDSSGFGFTGVDSSGFFTGFGSSGLGFSVASDAFADTSIGSFATEPVSGPTRPPESPATLPTSQAVASSSVRVTTFEPSDNGEQQPDDDSYVSVPEFPPPQASARTTQIHSFTMRSFMPFSILLLCLFEVSHALSAPAILKGRGVVRVRPRPDEPEIEAPTGITALVPTPGEPEIQAPTRISILVPTTEPGERPPSESPAVTFSTDQATPDPSTLKESEESGPDISTPDRPDGGSATEPVSGPTPPPETPATLPTSQAVASSSVRVTTWSVLGGGAFAYTSSFFILCYFILSF